MSRALSSLVLLALSHPVMPEDVDTFQANHLSLRPIPFLVFKSWPREYSRVSLSEHQFLHAGGISPSTVCVKETVTRPIPKKPNLLSDYFNNYRPIANIPFMGKLVKRAVAGQ